MNARFRSISFGVILALATIGGSLGAGAQTGTPAPLDQQPLGAVFSLRPVDGADLESLGIELDAGQSGELTVVLGNLDKRPLILRTYVADAVSGPNGGFGLLEEPAPVSPPTTWIDYSPESYELAPEESIERAFTVTVPPGTPPGQYVSGIALQTAEPIEVPGTAFFNQIVRKVVPVFVTVPGPVEASAELGTPSVDADATSTRLVIPIQNTGNILLQPSGQLTLRNESGMEVLTAPIAMSQVYAGHQTIIDVTVPPQTPPGDYTLDLALEDADTDWSAALSDVSLTLPERAEPGATPEPVPVEITSASVTAVPDAASGDPPQYAEVSVEITNRAAAVSSSRLTMTVERDGEPVEQFVLAENLALLDEVTTVEQRYIPANGWEEGTYTFSLLLESVDPASGVEAVLATIDVDDQVEVP